MARSTEKTKREAGSIARELLRLFKLAARKNDIANAERIAGELRELQAISLDGGENLYLETHVAHVHRYRNLGLAGKYWNARLQWWCQGPESNWLRPPFQGGALPMSYPGTFAAQKL